MCGITGILNIDMRPVPLSILEKMTDIVEHRGPDGRGIWHDRFVGLGHRRLAVIDLSPLGNQPMENDDGTLVITYNGEVYNFQEIRSDLESRGYSFISRTDTEVILKSYEEWGQDCVSIFNGMFAFAIWDMNKNTLFLARDRYGIKPLYYCLKDNVFLFGSEIKSILQHPCISVEVSIPALNEYFSFQNIFSDLTLFKGVRILKAGHTLSIKSGDINFLRLNRYWDFHFCEESNGLGEEEYVSELIRLFKRAVRRQLVSDVEIGSYLSGGIDSASISCIAAKKFKNIKSFTCGFDLTSASGLELGFDEREKAEFLSNRYKTEHYEVVLKAGDMERVMEELIWHLEDLRVGQSYPNFYVARLASKFVKVVLTGAGGDELFAGYPWRYYRAMGSDHGEDYIESYYRYWQRLIPDSLKPKFYQPEIYPDIWDYQTKDVFKSVINGNSQQVSSPEEYVNLSLYFEIRTFLHGLLEVEDKLSMAHGLETRVPFLDNDLVDFGMKVPVRFKLNNLYEIIKINENELGKNKKYFSRMNNGKTLLRKALTQYVPDYDVNGLKQGFSAPDASWFKGESIDYIKNLLFNKHAEIYNYIQPETAQALMEEHFHGKTNRRLLIWSMLCFEWWNRIFKPA